ncbi:hypothetical protein SAMN06295905_3203 [Devosia lucknowensis]|uniref:Uncharacterized protein n=1 Tax=Devosia lucknowensis TaxID=1096929 RepID=A0A1Y6GAY1_9HYPH|nr:hypothetical protein [Devosia lucknowensis]SMQ85908.1 hypothetical protein SAMN06295905_3203 [Devosia lucknowensis]
MLIASWDEIEADLKLGVFLMTVAAQSLIGDRKPEALAFGTAALGEALDNGQAANAQAYELDDLRDFNVSKTQFWKVARICFEFVQDKSPLDKLDVGDLQGDTLNWMTYFQSAIPHDEYGTGLGTHSNRFREHANKGAEYPLPGLHLAASAKANLVQFLQGFPLHPDMDTGFAPYEIASLAGMNIASVRNFVGPRGGKPIRSMQKDSWGSVYGHPLDALQWLAGRRNFNPGPLSEDWLHDVADRIETPEQVGALIGIYAWVNRITTETIAERGGLSFDLVRDWTRGHLTSTDDAVSLARAAHVDPEFYCDLVARCGGFGARI